jgi:hypothetical protein
MPKSRGAMIAKLDDVECLYKIVMASKVTFAFKHGTLVIYRVDPNDLEFIIRYRLGENNFETGITNIKMLEGDLIECNNKVYQVNKIVGCTKEKLVFAEATLFSDRLEPPPFRVVAA